MDNITTWNIGGLNGPNKQKDNKVGLLTLMETKVRQINFTKEKDAFQGWTHFVNYNTSDRGILWIMWLEHVFQVQILSSTTQLVHCMVKHIFSTKVILIIFYILMIELEGYQLLKMMFRISKIASVQQGCKIWSRKDAIILGPISKSLVIMLSRIDKVLVNGLWLSAHSNFEVIFLPDETSDHYLGLIKFFDIKDEPKPFNFFDM
ncbi:hypothetical protein Cgig2_019681 [Carnegiea gigantea]|uniref:Uncharacterized protein n=1 Tax=Carnegiea gigantea TaxID=171969 RepID=A0A9Q1K0C0_9CARY|nr:hypothetical protein Cgig2_019681 [Carnegiea gigantea]